MIRQERSGSFTAYSGARRNGNLLIAAAPDARVSSASMSKTRLVIVVLALQALSLSAANANPFQYQWQQLSPAVRAGIRQDPFELPQEGNSVFVVTDEGVVVFDAGGSPLMGESIVAKVRSVTDRPITHVIISHWHGDHMRGLQAIRSAFPHVEVLSHPFARDFIASTQEMWLKRQVSMGRTFAKRSRHRRGADPSDPKPLHA